MNPKKKIDDCPYSFAPKATHAEVLLQVHKLWNERDAIAPWANFWLEWKIPPMQIEALGTGYVPKFTYEQLRETFLTKMWKSKGCVPIILYLEVRLEQLGCEFFSPGGSSRRVLCSLIATAFRAQGSFEEYLEDRDVKVCIDLLALEFLRRNDLL